MAMNPRERDYSQAKKDQDDEPNTYTNYKFPNNNTINTSSSSRQWSSSAHKNPRIVRVSRNFGGKDRHSKVCTVRGLRDRRIRLSVPTAIQLYDLQDRLGLSQPSKVVDWLIDATKQEIDKLPPLPMLPGNYFAQFHQPIVEKNLGMTKNIISDNDLHQQKNNHDQGFGGSSLSEQNLFPLTNNNSFPNLMPYNSYNSFHNWDPSSLSLSSQFGGGYNTDDHHHESQNSNLSTVIQSNSQLYLFPSAANIPSILPTFPSYIATPSVDHMNIDQWRSQMNQFQHFQQNNPLLPTTLHLISSPMKNFVSSKSVHSQGNHGAERPDDKDNRNS